MIFRLELKAERFDDTVVCLGAQVATVIGAIERLRPGLHWYVADIDCFPTIDGWRPDPAPVRAGGSVELWAMVSAVGRFELGGSAGPAER